MSATMMATVSRWPIEPVSRTLGAGKAWRAAVSHGVWNASWVLKLFRDRGSELFSGCANVIAFAIHAGIKDPQP
jgi:hypothetical protein